MSLSEYMIVTGLSLSHNINIGGVGIKSASRPFISLSSIQMWHIANPAAAPVLHSASAEDIATGDGTNVL